MVVGNPHGGSERALEAVTAHCFRQAFGVLADVSAAPGQARFGVGMEPPLAEHDTQQLVLGT